MGSLDAAFAFIGAESSSARLRRGIARSASREAHRKAPTVSSHPQLPAPSPLGRTWEIMAYMSSTRILRKRQSILRAASMSSPSCSALFGFDRFAWNTAVSHFLEGIWDSPSMRPTSPDVSVRSLTRLIIVGARVVSETCRRIAGHCETDLHEHGVDG